LLAIRVDEGCGCLPDIVLFSRLEVFLYVDLAKFHIRELLLNALVFLSLRGTRPARFLGEEDYFDHK